MISAVLISAVITAAAVGVEMSTRKAQERLTEESGRGTYTDDDDKWIWGLFYYNPRDSHSFVNDRIGTGMTVNLARPAGKLMGTLALLILLAIPFIMPITNAVLNKPPELILSSTELTARSGGTEYVLGTEEIEHAELMDALPDGLVRINGTGLETLYKGRFSSEATGAVTVCLDPTAGPYIFIETESGSAYIFGTRDSKVTEEIFENIKEH